MATIKTIEEKAKAYDEAIERAKVFKEHLLEINEKDYANEMNYIFPELKESEDEKIRKDIVEAVELHKDFTQVRKEHIYAWLKKQDEHKKFRDSIQIGDKVTRNQDGVLVNLSQLKRIAKPAENKGKHNMGISEATKQELEDNLNKALEKETPESCNEFLEKQDEQGPYASETMNEKVDFDSGFTRMMEKEQKPWSEEDDQYLLVCKNALAKYQVSDKWDATIISRWLENRLKSFMPKNDITDEELAKAKKDAYNDILDKIEYDSENPTFDDGWNAAIWYLKKRNAKPQITWKPSDEQMKALLNMRFAVERFGPSASLAALDDLYEQLKKL